MDYIPTLITIIGALVAITNIIVEVLKKLTWDKIPTNILATIVALVLTMAAFFAWTSYAGIAIVWYYVAAAFVVGMMVAYAAMFGFDKLKEVLNSLRGGGTQ